MKRRIVILSLMCLFIIGAIINVNAKNDTYTLEMEVVNNKNDDIDIYILLPKEYILHVIAQDYLITQYNGANTLIKNNIPSIQVKKENVQTEVYKGDGTEYVQILLEENKEGIYEFDILSSYAKMNMKYRVKNQNKDYIMHIDQFKIEDGKCQIQYDYEKETVKQPGQIVITTATKILIFLLILIVITGTIAYVKQRS